MFWIELIIVLAIIFIGVRVGGTFLAMAGGIGMFIMTFILHVTPSDPPVTVILIMIAVICAAATMQACGGLDYLVRIAEKILRKNPKMITVLAPVVAYIFTFMCGTGHIVYSLLPVINEIAIETGVRPERPISASIVSSQQAITACPISAATVGILAFMAEATNYTKVNIFTLLIVCVPATLIGTIVAAIAVIKKGKELADDPEFQARVEAGLIEDFSKKVKEEKKVSKEAKISVTIFLIAMVGIVLLGAVSGLVPTLADGSKLPLTTVIEIFMLVAAAAMILLTKLDSNKVLDQPVFRTGMFAVVLAFGLCWLVNTFIGDQSSFITDNMSALTNKYPWIFIVAVFIVGAITTSQSSTTMIMIPIGIALGLPANVIVAGWIACSSNYFIPASGQCVAALAFDSAGTTKIGKFVLNHSYMIPGLATIDLGAATGAKFGRSCFSGAYMGEYGVYVSNSGEAIRHRKALGIEDMKLLFKVNPEADAYLVQRDVQVVAKSIMFGDFADGLCVSGAAAGAEPDDVILSRVHEVAKPRKVPVFCNTGCNHGNVREKLGNCDGVCMGTAFKKDGVFNGRVDKERVREFMEIVADIRKGL